MAFRDWLPPALSLRFGMAPIAGVAAQEKGVSGTENYGGTIRREDYNPDFDDWQKAVPIYDKMRRTDSMIRSMLQVIKLPLRGATWQCNPASDDPVDKQIAEFCTNALFDDDSMDDPWDYTLRHILLMLDFGVSVLEKVWKVDDEGYYKFKRLAPRLPKTLREWHVNREGKLIALVQYAPVSTFSGREDQITKVRYGGSISYQYLTIPAEYVAVFNMEREGDNYQGTSLLRNVYRNWWFKDQAYHIMGVGLDRWGVGIPIVQLEEGHKLTAGDKDTLVSILQRIRANEQAYMVMPEHSEFTIQPSGGGQGTQSHFGIQWIDHQDSQIARNVLASFLTMGRDPVGTLGFGSRLTDMFISSLDGIAAGVGGDIKRQLVKPLCDLNFDMSRRKYPEPVCLDLEQTELSAYIEALTQLTGTMITPQDDDEDRLRKMLRMAPLKGQNRGKRTPGAMPGKPGEKPGEGKPGAPGAEGEAGGGIQPGHKVGVKAGAEQDPAHAGQEMHVESVDDTTKTAQITSKDGQTHSYPVDKLEKKSGDDGEEDDPTDESKKKKIEIKIP